MRLGIRSKKNKILLRLIEKLRYSDVITDFKTKILPKYSSKSVLQWQYKAFFSAKIFRQHFEDFTKVILCLYNEAYHL